MGTGAGTEGETGGGYLRGSEEPSRNRREARQSNCNLVRFHDSVCAAAPPCTAPAVLQESQTPLQSCSSFCYTFRIRKAELNADFAQAFP